MSTVATSEVVEFHRFLSDGLQGGSNWKTPEQALAYFRRQRPISKELADSAAEIQQALDEIRQGDCGRPAEEISSEMRRRLGLAARS